MSILRSVLDRLVLPKIPDGDSGCGFTQEEIDAAPDVPLLDLEDDE